MIVRCRPLHRSVPSWLILLAAILLTGAVGGTALARLPAAVADADGCRDDEGCKPAITAAPQPSILQTSQRADGKALPEPPILPPLPMAATVPCGQTGITAGSRVDIGGTVSLLPPGHPPRAPPQGI